MPTSGDLEVQSQRVGIYSSEKTPAPTFVGGNDSHLLHLWELFAPGLRYRWGQCGCPGVTHSSRAPSEGGPVACGGCVSFASLDLITCPLLLCLGMAARGNAGRLLPLDQWFSEFGLPTGNIHIHWELKNVHPPPHLRILSQKPSDLCLNTGGRQRPRLFGPVQNFSL